MEKIRVGVIGTGGMGITHAGAYMLDDRVRVIAACGRTQSKLEKFVNKDWPKVEYYEGDFRPQYRIAKAYEDYRDLVEDGEIDVVSICTPNSLHYPMAKVALQNGKHVLIEKPITETYEQARNLVELAKEKNRQLTVGHMWRFHLHVQYVKELIQEDVLGNIIKLKGYGIHEGWIPTEGWFVDKDLAGGGALIDMGIHPIDTIRFLLEGHKVTEVYANMTTAYGDYKLEDIGAVQMKFDNGSFAIVEFGWGNPHADGVESSIQIFGEKGYMRIFPTELKCKLQGIRGRFEPELAERHLTKSLYEKEISHFVDSLSNGEKSIISGEEGAETLRVVEAAYKSNESGKVIRLN